MRHHFAQTIGPAHVIDGGMVNIQLLMFENDGYPFDSDSDPDPESYNIHAGSG
jgi:hypothetical protein